MPLSEVGVNPPKGTIFAVAWSCLQVANFSELRKGEVRRIPLLRGWVNKGKKKGRGLTAPAQLVSFVFSPANPQWVILLEEVLQFARLLLEGALPLVR